ncbi:sensor histidine kinase [Herbaspirillum sp. SJZ107]|uniref:sensor histidine kinase n=1 Tax=Herbaspirillum sp. SJZ107 TaxID=2572881 RepID=UPI00116B6069|nr:sensor histidine kinase [Herbaspirillum sp. SJZ107]TQK08233.1 histidine kinase-like protein [Herbaspirillum sp. SJZ107]
MLQRYAPCHHLLTVAVHTELDVIASRLRAREIAALCGFRGNEQTRIATAVSELARNAMVHARVGTVRFFLGASRRQQALVIVVDDQGSGIPAARVRAALNGDATPAPGGLSAARRFMDEFEIVTNAGGTSITSAKAFPPQLPNLPASELIDAVNGLADLPGNVALSEANQQNRELSGALAALQAKQNELVEVSAHLERTNRQVEALNVLLKEKADSLVSADRRKDEFLSILSHELRGPLSAAGMAAGLLETGGTPDQSVRLGQLVGRQVRHMSRLVEDLLDVSRVSRGLVSIRRQGVDMRDVIGAAIEQLAASALAKDHRVETALPPDACMVEGDRTRLIQVVANLLGNAIRYTPRAGMIEVRAERNGADLLVRVSDNGIGIPDTLMPHLFDLYTQAEHSPDARDSGLGLGLALVKSLVEAHGGNVSACSAGAGHGSRFDVWLPLAAAHAGAAA